MAITAYYIQRLSDGKILRGDGPNTPSPYSYDPWYWSNLTGTQLDLAHWVMVDTAQPFRTYSYILGNIVDGLPRENGDWTVDMFRLLPVVKNI